MRCDCNEYSVAHNFIDYISVENHRNRRPIAVKTIADFGDKKAEKIIKRCNNLVKNPFTWIKRSCRECVQKVEAGRGKWFGW